MRPVTDPALLEQLDGVQSDSGLKPVQDPNLLAQLEGRPQVDFGNDFIGDLSRQTYKRLIGAKQLASAFTSPIDTAIHSLLPSTIQERIEQNEQKMKNNEDIIIDSIRQGEKDRGLAALPAAFLDPVNAIPLGAIDKATKLGRAGQAALAGGKFGVISGALEPQKQGESRLDDIATQGLLGGVLGGVTQPILDVASQGIKGLGQYLFKVNPEKISQMESVGMNPTIQATTERPWVAQAANVLENIPGVGRAFKKTAEGYEDVAANTLKNAGLRGVIQPEDAGRTLESGLRNTYGITDLNEEAAWNALEQAFPPTSLVEASNVVGTIGALSKAIPEGKGLTQQQITEQATSPVLTQARKAFEPPPPQVIAPEKSSLDLYLSGQPRPAPLIVDKEAEELAKRTTTYGALNQARKDVFAKAKDLGVTQPGLAGEESGKASSLYGAFKSDVRNQLEKEGIDTGLLDAADTATQAKKVVADKIDAYFGDIKKKVTPSGASFEVIKTNERTPETAFNKVISGLKKGGSELNELRQMLTPEENLVLTDGIYRHLSADDTGISKIKWADNYRKFSDEGRLAFANNDPKLKSSLDDLSSAIRNIRNIQGFDTAKSANRLITAGAVGTPTGLLSVMFGVHLGASGGLIAGVGSTFALSKALSKLMNDPVATKALADWTRLAPSKVGLARKGALNSLYKAIGDSQYLSDEDKQILIKANEQGTPNAPQTPTPAAPVTPPPALEPAPDKGAGNDIPLDIIKEEGLRLSAYKDQNNNITVGYGFNMDDDSARKRWEMAGIDAPFQDVKRGRVALTQEQADKLAQFSYKLAQDDARRIFPNFDKLSPNRQAALTNLSYQWGGTALGKNKDVILAIKNGRFNAAANRLARHPKAQDTSKRAKRIITMLAKDLPYDKV